MRDVKDIHFFKFLRLLRERRNGYIRHFTE